MSRNIPIFFLLLFSLTLSGQKTKELKFFHYSSSDGLTSSNTTKIIQDKKGFIWVGTEDGLNRFDGYKFKPYRKIVNDSTSLVDNSISDLFIDSRGGFWIGTFHGLSFYNPDFDSFINYFLDRDNTHNPENRVSSIAENKQKQIFVSIEQGKVFRFDYKKNVFAEVIDIYKAIKFIFCDNDGFLWLFADDIYIYNQEMQLDTVLTIPNVKYPYNCMIEDDDKYWIGTEGSGFFWYDKKSRALLESFQLNSAEDNISYIYKDKSNDVWIGSVGNLRLYDRKDKVFYNYVGNDFNLAPGSIPGTNAFYQDIEGNYWALFKKAGVSIAPVRKPFENLTNTSNNQIVLTSKVYSSVLIDNENNLLAGSYRGGLDIVDFKDKNVTNYIYNPDNPYSIGQESVLMLYQDSKLNIWVGTYREGLQKFDKKEGRFKHYEHDPNNEFSIGGNDIRAMAEDNNGNLWVATHGTGLDKFDSEKEIFYHYKADYNFDTIALANDWLTSVVFDYNGELWIGSTYGLSRFNIEQNRFTNYRNEASDTNSLSNNYINVLFEDSDSNLWVGTNDGLNLFDCHNNRFHVFTEADGLPNNFIQGILEDEHGNLWISTNNGISMFDKNKLIFKNYNIDDGLASNEFNPNACSKAKDGRLYFGSNSGIVSFFPNSIKDNSYVSPTLISGLKIYNKQVIAGKSSSPLQKDIMQIDELILDYKQSAVITFEFVSFSYSVKSKKKRYAYMLEGFDKDWVYSGTRREATYTNLDPGKYIFHVKSSNNDNIWNETGDSIRLIIKPPWWNTWWFRITLILFITIALFVAYSIKVAQIKRRNLFLEKTVKERTHEIANKNRQLQESANNLQEINELLVEKQQQIEEQSEELLVANEQLQESNHRLNNMIIAKDKIISIIGHDLKNPINTIMGFSELLQLRSDGLSKEKRQNFVGYIHRASKNTYQLLVSLLDWARSQNELTNYSPQKTQINKLIRSQIQLLNEQSKKKNIEMTYKGSDENDEVLCDERMVATVLRNLLNNAIKFTNRNGKITLSHSMKHKPGYCTVQIVDTGVGMGEEVLKELFSRKHSNSSTGTEGEKGTGLGLNLCKDFIAKNDGELWVESQLGVGTTFSFTLPSERL